jgi:hypothetical protein
MIAIIKCPAISFETKEIGLAELALKFCIFLLENKEKDI